MPDLGKTTLPAPVPAPLPTPSAPAPVIAAPSAGGCPGGPDCPQEPDALSEAAEEILQELAQCAAQGEDVEECLLDDPPPPRLSQLPGEDLMRLTGCLGSSHLDETKDRWQGCVRQMGP
jgi:hypothetical protein